MSGNIPLGNQLARSPPADLVEIAAKSPDTSVIEKELRSRNVKTGIRIPKSKDNQQQPLNSTTLEQVASSVR